MEITFPARMAWDEIRGMTLQEVRDMEFSVQQSPRTPTVLFETDELLGLRNRAAAAGVQVIEPVLADIPATEEAPALRFMELRPRRSRRARGVLLPVLQG